MPTPARPRVRVRPRHGVVDRRLRLVIGVLLMLAAILCIAFAEQSRMFEADVVRTWFSPLAAGGVEVRAGHFVLGGDRTLELPQSPDALIGVLLAPVALIGGVILAATKVGWKRVGLSVLVATALIVLVDQLRLGVLLGGSLLPDPDAGTELAQRLVGPLVSILGVSTAYVVFVLLIAELPLFRRQEASRALRRSG